VRWSLNSWCKVIVTFIVMLLTGNLLAQTTIISTISGDGGFDLFGSQVDMAAWSQTSLYNNVSVSAELDGVGSTITGTAYLVTQVGSGTTSANQIMSADFTVSTLPFEPDLTTLFSGLTLGPGTYYLVITASGGGWEISDPSATSVMAPGVTLVAGNYTTNPGNVDQSYPPDDAFSSAPESSNLEFVVSTPEPPVSALLGFGLISMTVMCRKAFRRHSLN
jgi:hypothetical protein